MASAKDVFEPKTFAANSFAAGVWRGIGPFDIIAGPFRYIATGTHQPGAAAIGTHQPGAKAHGTHQPGGKAAGTL